MDQCNLIINYLPRYIDDAGLRNMFAEHGEIIQAKVARNKETGESLTYGFVKYSCADDAAAAISAKNGLELGNKQLKVSLARRKPEDIQNRKLHVSQLPKSYSEEEVRKVFSEYGDIIECRLLLEADRITSRGVAFIEYNLASECQTALQRMQGVVLPGAAVGISVNYARPPPSAGNTMMSIASVEIPEVPLEGLPAALSPVSGRPWTFAPPAYPMHAVSVSVPFIPTPHMTIPAVSPTHPTPFFVDPASPRAMTLATGQREVSMYIRGLPSFTTIRVLYDTFSPYGYVVGAELNLRLTGRPDGALHDGCGYVRMFITTHQIDEVNRTLNNVPWFQGYPPVQITFTE